MTYNQTGHILKMQMAHGNMSKPLVLVFAGPNGSGKSTLNNQMPHYGEYVNADDLKDKYALTDLEAAEKAAELRNKLLNKKADFTFETVLSTDRNIILLEKAKKKGYQVHCIYVLTCNADINVARVKIRVLEGGHDVPEEKIRSRYVKALKLLPRLIKVCDKIFIYDNSIKNENTNKPEPFCIFIKDENGSKYFPTEFWTSEKIQELVRNN